MIGQRRPAVAVHPELAEKDNVAEAIDQVLDEVRAAGRDLRVTGFCLQQVEALRRIDRAKTGLLLVWCSPEIVERTTDPRAAPMSGKSFSEV